MSNNNDSFSMADLTAALNQEGPAGIVNPPNSEWRGFAGTLSSIAENVTPKVEKLRKIQRQHDKLNAMLTEEREALEAKYQKLYQPLYNQRFDIVNGLVEVDGGASGVKGIPGFWLMAMKNNCFLVDKITEHDEEALKYLKDIKLSMMEEPKGFKLEFFFDSNPFFKNSVLTKMYPIIHAYECILEQVTGTEIEWYPGKCLTQMLLKKKQPTKGSKNAEPVTKAKCYESFFSFFQLPQFPGKDDEELRAKMKQDYSIGLIIRHQIIPRAVLWFTGEARKGYGLGLKDVDIDDSSVRRKQEERKCKAGEGQQGEWCKLM